MAPRILAGLKRVMAGHAATFFTTYLCPFDGLHHWYQIAVAACEFSGLRHAVVMHVDVSSLQVDALTGLANRAMFDAQLALNLDTARKSGRQTGTVFADINHLKIINDTHGHLVGDQAVKALGARLVGIAGPGAVVTRIGGDEFGIVLPVSDEAAIPRDLRAALTNGVNCSIEIDRTALTVSASLGVAYFPDDGTTARALLTAADRAMYKQKRASAT
jgi:diguanylate cyclase (GGDEF)-like protein